MGLIEEIKKCFMENEIPQEPIFRAVTFGDSGIYLENVRQIVSYTPERIEFGLKKGGLVVSGKCMYIKKFCGGDVAICGKIIKTERVF
ncbi:MAG: YabP/YqfC family sporulation protein [Clostridia bacterium]|nr:YabP/YqfC family sporulation protein [Clostridia bacterium]